ncbi:hypothetical protein GIB67_011368 [Kingdonia uniflora]|uniref:Serine-rich protein-like protein n=1 Tax=Kingdonia uniflora TaxID=39325 RepID=A0A7J7LCR9_9MAGN|nr:hypothetical protein GIB67_011368 [Kingdonia uniflora]
MATRTTRSRGPVLGFQTTPNRYSSSPSPSSSSSSGFTSTFSSSYSRSTNNFFQRRSPSPTHYTTTTTNSSSPSVRFSSSTSPSQSIVTSPRDTHQQFLLKKRSSSSSSSSSSSQQQKKTCMCSPTTHPGSFRCSLHKNLKTNMVSFPSNRLNPMRRSAMTNSLVRIGTVEGDLVKRALAALIRPSSHQQKRRETFTPKPSRLSIMTKADNDDF